METRAYSEETLKQCNAKVQAAWRSAIVEARIRVVVVPDMVPGGDCQRFAGPFDGKNVAPVVFDDPSAANRLADDVTAWVKTIAKDGVTQIEVRRWHPEVHVSTDDIETKALWVAYARLRRIPAAGLPKA